MTRTKSVLLRVNENEINLLKFACKISGLPISSFFRTSGIEKARQIVSVYKKQKLEATA